MTRRSSKRLIAIVLLSLIALIPFVIVAQVEASAVPSGVTQLGATANQYGSLDTLTNFTVPAGTDRLLVVMVSHTASFSLTGATFDGTNMAQVVYEQDGFASMAYYALPMGTSMSSTTADIQMFFHEPSYTTPTDEKYMAAVVFQNVDQTTPTEAEICPDSHANCHDANILVPGVITSSLTIPSEVGDLVMSHFNAWGIAEAPAITHGSSQVVQFPIAGGATTNPNSGGEGYFVGTTIDGDISVTSAFTAETVIDEMVIMHIAINVNPAHFITPQPEPSNQPTNFGATATSSSRIVNTWDDATGATLPESYLVLCSTTNSFTAPADGFPVAEDLDCSDGAGAQAVAYGAESAEWLTLNQETEYFFTIYAFNNVGVYLDYKTDNAPTASATTLPPCPGFPMTVGHETELETAILCYNAELVGDHAINLSQNFGLTANTPAINNPNAATLTINGAGFAIDGATAHRIFEVIDGDVTFSDITLANGNDTNGDCSGDNCGGALKVGVDGTVAIEQTTFTGNQAHLGGGLYSEGTVSVVDSTFTGNSATGFGGSITTSGDPSSMVMTRTIVAQNTAPDAGGLMAWGDVNIWDSTFDSNSATGNHGGGMYIGGSRVYVYNSTFSNNTASNFGGGIVLLGFISIEDSTLSDNNAARGGGLLAFDGDAVLHNTTVSGNTATVYAGGVGNVFSGVTLRHTTVTENTSPLGAGVTSRSVFDAVTWVESSLIAGNVVSPTGGAEVQIHGGTDNTFTSNDDNIVGSIGPSVVLNGANDVTGVADPMLGALADNGCMMQHQMLSGLGCVETHAVLPGSAAVNHGLSSAETHDQRTAPRSMPDSGAFEVIQPTITSTAAVTITENITTALDVDADDFETGLVFSVSGGVDSALFEIDSATGVLSFLNAPDYETPLDDGMNNVYNVQVTVTDAHGWTDVQDITVTVTDLFDCTIGAVSNTAELNAAIACYNVAPTDHYSITITQDMTLTAQTTFIEGDGTLSILGNGNTIDGADQYNIFTIVQNSSVLIADLTIQHGTNVVPLCGVFECGGAIYALTNQTVTLQSSVVQSNTVDGNGSGIYRTLGPLVLIDSVVKGNIALQDGAGVYVDEMASLSVQNSTFDDNYAFRNGGGIFANEDSVITVEGSVFTYNQADSGGGLYLELSTTVDIATSEIANNMVSNEGGGIYNRETLNISDTTVRMNDADGGGGLYAGSNSQVSVKRSTFFENSAGTGAGILMGSGHVDLYNSTLSGNIALMNGGGLYLAYSGATADLFYSTLVENSADSGGGIYSFGGFADINSSLVANNTDGADCFSDNPAGLQTDGASFDSDGTCGDATQSSNLQLGMLQDNGGTTWTHAIAAGSDAVDAGDATTCAVADVQNVDQRGIARTHGMGCDAGAYEYNGVPTVVTLSHTSTHTLSSMWVITLMALALAISTKRLYRF